MKTFTIFFTELVFYTERFHTVISEFLNDPVLFKYFCVPSFSERDFLLLSLLLSLF